MNNLYCVGWRILSNWLWISCCGGYWQQAELRTDGACRIMMMIMLVETFNHTQSIMNMHGIWMCIQHNEVHCIQYTNMHSALHTPKWDHGLQCRINHLVARVGSYALHNAVAPLESSTPKRVRGWEGMFPLQPNRVLGRVVQAAQQGQGQSPGRKRIWWNWKSKNTSLTLRI